MKNEKKFTQGKWLIGGYEIATVLTNQVTITQEFTDKSLSEKEVEEISVANAKLISAAPELLQACEYALSLLKKIEVRGDCVKHLESAIAQAIF